MEIEGVEHEFEPLRTELRKLERHCNPDNKNLHFYHPETVDSALFTSLLNLAREGLKKVNEHRDFFLYKEALYADGQFWYGLFVLINSTVMKFKVDSRQGEIPDQDIETLLVILVEISEYTTAQPGDILKRNYEALGNTLYAFYSKERVDFLLRKSREVGDKTVQNFVSEIITRVEEILESST